MTTSSQLTFDQLAALARARQDQAAAAAAEAERQVRMQNIYQLRASFPLTEAERSALEITFSTYSNSTVAFAQIVRVWGEHRVTIAPSPGRRDHWDVEVRGDTKTHRLFVDCPSSELCDRLVLAIAEYRAAQDRKLAEAAARDERRIAQLAEDRARRDAIEADQAVRAVAIEAVRQEVLAAHAVIQAEVDAHVAAAHAAAWVWPAGRGLMLYHWRWQVAGAVDSDGCLCAEHDDGWSLMAELDAHGFVLLQPERGRAKPRTVRPSAYVVVEGHLFASVDELPDDLRRRAVLTIPGIGMRDWDDPGERVDVQTPEGEPPLIRGEHKQLYIELGKEPLPWVRQLLDEHAA